MMLVASPTALFALILTQLIQLKLVLTPMDQVASAQQIVEQLS
jgi:hypothetical protein